MRSSPRRPLILKRRKLNLSQKDGTRGPGTPEQRPTPMMRVTGEHGQSLAKRADVPSGQSLAGKTRATATPQPSLTSRMLISPQEQSQFSESIAYPDEGQTSSLEISASCAPPSAGITANAIKVMGHPTIPDTQLVVIPPNSDVESIIQALTLRGREGGGPNKFILISGSPSFHIQAEKLGFQSKEEEVMTLQIEAASAAEHTEDAGEGVVKVEGEDLNISLTNIQWLGKMATDGLGTCDVVSEPVAEEENATLKAEKESAEPSHPQQWPVSISERPPYSYMALIQFAINSTADKRMTLKDIYTWIEDHFPYFKLVAKPGWKNSIRHNLSLHDMFVRESLSNNKISYWTIHPQANRCLTLDQVYKATGPTTSECSEPKLPIPDLRGRMQSAVAKAPERKMKPLLPRIDSYFVPVQFPVTQPVLFSPVEAFCTDPGLAEALHSAKRVKIAPKVLMAAKESPAIVPALDVKAEHEPAEVKSETPFQCRRASGSRRKQQLTTPRSQDPELVLPDCSAADSGLDTDFSFLQDTQAQEGSSQITQDEDCTFKTPIKERLKAPASSTPSKPPEVCALPPWDFESPLTRSLLPDLSPVRIPCSTALTPFKDSYGALNFGETPFKDLPFFGSPADLIGTFSPSSPQSETLDTPKGLRKRCSKELQVGGPANRSLLEGLVLDTKDESLSKILLDISFSGMEEDNIIGGDNSYLGQLLSELR